MNPADRKVAARPSEAATIVGPEHAADGAPRFLASRQLVFGIIALQSDFLSREQLVAAFDAWVHDKSRSLADILQTQGALSTEDRQILELLVTKFIKKHAGNAEQSLLALSSVEIVRPELERLHDPDLQASLGHVGKASAADAFLASTQLLNDGKPLARFRILRPHASGGLGQVSVALDQDLNREVALKEIHPQHADNPISRERFVQEAEITGGLEHPGIVPVYALGQTPDGRPFYAMRFVKGDSLKRAIEVYHSPDSPTRRNPGERQLALRQLLQRFIDVCNAVEYAHSRGVLHRDLKPGNIMVGKYGETLVVDWGLAKSVAKKDIVSDEATLRPATALSSSIQTQPGSAIGTPAYMSPEQAAGKLADLGPASDIYSLGATLYHLLCGRPAFEKQELAEILGKVQRGDFPKPRSVASDIPRALEAICLHAMALQATARYPSPRALADDLEHWLADEPIVAAPEKLGERISRVARRQRGLVRSVGCATGLVAVVSLAAAMLINAQRRRAEENGRLAQRHLYAAHMNLAQNAWDGARLGAVRDLLDRHLPSADEVDFRGFEWHYWNRLCRNDWPVLAGQTRPTCFAVSRDGTRIATGTATGTINFWNAVTGQKTQDFQGHPDTVTAIAVSGDGTRFASATHAGTVQLWDLASDKKPLTLNGNTGWIYCVAYSPDGMRIASASRGGTVQIWDAATGLVTGTLEAHTFLSSVAFSPDGKQIASSSEHEATVRLWDAATGEELHALEGHTGGTWCVAFSPDETRIATAGSDMTVKLWDAATGTELRTLEGHANTVTCVAISSDAASIASGSDDQTVRLWNAATGQLIHTLKGHTSTVSNVAFIRDDTWLISGSKDGRIRRWNGARGQGPRRFKGHAHAVTSVAFSPDGRTIVSSSEQETTVKLWDADTEAEIRALEGHQGDVWCVAFSPDGTTIASGSSDATVKFWDAGVDTRPRTLAGGHIGYVASVAFSPDGKRLASTSQHDGIVKLWDVTTGHEVVALEGHTGGVWCVAFSPDGKRIGTAGDDQTVRVWDLVNVQKTQTLKGHAGQVKWVAFSPDGTRIASAACDQTVKLWDAATGRNMLTLKGHTGCVNCVAFSPDGMRIASASVDQTVKLWDTTTGQETLTLNGNLGRVSSVAFSPDGRRIATASAEGTVNLWDAGVDHESEIPERARVFVD
jgi:WD40 repeat protein/tRNA A-37 threonylcarbamoyl transferase component Bud32